MRLCPTTPIKLTLESAVEFIDDDELVEITPQSICPCALSTENERAHARRLKAEPADLLL